MSWYIRAMQAVLLLIRPMFLEIVLGMVSMVVAMGVHLWFRRHPSRRWALVAPVLYILFLTLCFVVLQRIDERNSLLETFINVAICFGAIRLVFLISTNRTVIWLLSSVIFSVFVLTLLELREPFAQYLDSYTLTISNHRFSLMQVMEVCTLLAVVGWFTHAFHRWLAEHIRSFDQLDPTVREWLVKLSELGLYFVAVVVILGICGIDVTTLAIFSGAVGVAIGMGLQKIASNYISGLILLFERTVKVGDVIELEGGPSGRIYRLDPRGTFILCTDGREVIVPNDEFVTKKVTNWTFSNTRGQVSIPVGVSYGSNVEKACDLLLEAAREHSLCLSSPVPTCNVVRFGPNAIHLVLQFWIADISPGVSGPQSEVMLAILRKFKTGGIEIPVVPHLALSET